MVRAARFMQKHIPAEYLDEMEGIAREVHVPYDSILLENVFLTLAEQTNPAALLTMPARCTNVVATGDATSMGQLLHGSTLDWGMGDVLKDRSVVLVHEPATGHPFVSVTWPGMVGTLRAMGAQGIAITEESCAAKDDTRADGIPVNLLMRKVVQYADDLDEAVRMVREAPGTCGYKVTISDGHRLDARVVEVTARHSHVRAPDRGLLFGCDPESPCVDGPCDAAIPRNDASSARRYPEVKARLEAARGTIRASLLSSALSTRSGGVLNDHTLLACLFEPQLGRFHVALGDDVDAAEGILAWRTHRLQDHISEDARRRYARPVAVTDADGVVALSLPFPGSVTLEDVHVPSPLPSGQRENDSIPGQLFMPKDAKGVVILLPIWKPGMLVGERVLALALAGQGLGSFVLPLPYQAGRAPPGVRSGDWTLSANLARTREGMWQAVADAARVSLWLEKERGIAPSRQGILGVSLGGHVAAVAAGAHPDRFAAGAFVLAGANVERSFLTENGTTDRIRRALLSRGVTPEEARDLMGDIDPAAFGRPDRKDRVVLIACRDDPVVPADGVRDLAEAWGGARIVWHEGDHYGLLRRLGEVVRELGAHFRGVFEAP
jgi:dienelactone hydrolase